VEELSQRARDMSESVLLRFVDMRAQWQSNQPPSEP
jgi:hypothetical protein